MKPVALDRRIGDLLKKFVKSTGETFRDSLLQSIFDYVNILSHICGDNPNQELLHIMHEFEMESQVIFRKMRQARKDYLHVRKEEAILLDKELPACDNYKYVILVIEDELYNSIEALIKRHPDVFSKDKKVTINDIVNRSILFRVMNNDALMENSIYRTWRLDVLLRREKRAKLNLEEALEIVSRKMKVTWR